jgi:hypothetical protein
MSDGQQTINFDSIYKKQVLTQILTTLEQINPNAVLIDGYQDCLVGITTADNSDNPVAVYSTLCIINKLMRTEAMDYDEANEYYSYNIAGSYMGQHSPLYIASFGACHCDE